MDEPVWQGDIFIESRLRDHLANERTFLAWLRTAMAVIAFGFVLDRFSLYVHYLAPTTSNKPVNLPTPLVGAGLMWVGTLLIPISLWQFLCVQRDIDQSGVTRTRKWLMVIFAGLVTLIALYRSITLMQMP